MAHGPVDELEGRVADLKARHEAGEPIDPAEMDALTDDLVTRQERWAALRRGPGFFPRLDPDAPPPDGEPLLKAPLPGERFLRALNRAITAYLGE
jgi:hypothetical protein